MSEFTAASGAKIVIGVAPFADAMALKNCIARELAGTNASPAVHTTAIKSPKKPLKRKGRAAIITKLRWRA